MVVVLRIFVVRGHSFFSFFKEGFSKKSFGNPVLDNLELMAKTKKKSRKRI